MVCKGVEASEMSWLDELVGSRRKSRAGFI